jgi:hypothetical protein
MGERLNAERDCLTPNRHAVRKDDMPSPSRTGPTNAQPAQSVRLCIFG